MKTMASIAGAWSAGWVLAFAMQGHWGAAAACVVLAALNILVALK